MDAMGIIPRYVILTVAFSASRVRNTAAGDFVKTAVINVPRWPYYEFTATWHTTRSSLTPESLSVPS